MTSSLGESNPVVKIECFAPGESMESIRTALAEAGFGRIGRYDSCASETRVTGYWRPLPGSQPFMGTVGEVKAGGEVKIEFVCRRDRAEGAAHLLRTIHPYEEPLILIVPLLNHEVEGSTTDIG
jgi:hypothetical protein